MSHPARLLDVRTLRTCSTPREELSATLVQLEVADFDPSIVRGLNRALTHGVAAWAYDQGYAGIAYSSRFKGRRDTAADCWALFDRNPRGRLRP